MILFTIGFNSSIYGAETSDDIIEFFEKFDTDSDRYYVNNDDGINVIIFGQINENIDNIAGHKVKLTITDPFGNEMKKKFAIVTPDGSFQYVLHLHKNSALGDYNIEGIVFNTKSNGVTFSLEEADLLPTEKYDYSLFLQNVPEQHSEQYRHIVKQAKQYWEDSIPFVNFNIVTDASQSDFDIIWSIQKQASGRLGYIGCDKDAQKPFIVINSEKFTSNQNNIQLDEKKLSKLITHEIGHLIGLNHYHDPDDIMNDIIFKDTTDTIHSSDDQIEIIHELEFCHLTTLDNLADELLQTNFNNGLSNIITNSTLHSLPIPLIEKIIDKKSDPDFLLEHTNNELIKQKKYSYSDSNKPIIFWLNNIQSNLHEQVRYNLIKMQNQVNVILETNSDQIMPSKKLDQIQSHLNERFFLVYSLKTPDKYHNERKVTEFSQYFTMPNTEKSKKYLKHLQDYLSIPIEYVGFQQKQENFHKKLDDVNNEKEEIKIRLASIEGHNSYEIEAELQTKYEYLSLLEITILRAYAYVLSAELQIPYSPKYSYFSDEQIRDLHKFIEKYEPLANEYSFKGFLQNHPKIMKEISRLLPLYESQEQILSKRLY
ncbi:MAG: matrixin family metalloprotease [Nitrosopumilus sp.]|nr:matrixin family metalloprotease [Nitrosopumilus sp.]